MKQIQAIRRLKVSFQWLEIIMITILTEFLAMAFLQDQIITKAALAQSITTTNTVKPLLLIAPLV